MGKPIKRYGFMGGDPEAWIPSYARNGIAVLEKYLEKVTVYTMVCEGRGIPPFSTPSAMESAGGAHTTTDAQNTEEDEQC